MVAVLASAVASADTLVQGQLTSHTTWTRAGSPYRMTGDVLVPSSVSLEIEAGVEVIAESSDAQNLGEDASKVELISEGTLYARGTAEQPIRIRGAIPAASSSASTWRGVRMRKGGVFSYVDVRDAVTGLYAGLFSNVEISYSVFAGNGDGVSMSFGNLTMHRTLLHGNGRGIVNYAGNSSSAWSRLDHLTVVGNTTGVWTTNHGRAQLALSNSIVAHNGTGLYGENFSARSLLANNDFWNNTTHYYGDVPDAASFSLDPLFVSATDFHLQATSPCRAAGNNGTDLGAHATTSTPVARVELTPHPVTVKAQSTTPFTARAYDSAGNLLPGASFTWSAKAAAGTITAQGVLSAQCSPGTVPAAVTVTSRNGPSASADVSITAGELAQLSLTPLSPTLSAGGQRTFSAIAADSCGNALRPHVTWSVRNGGGSIDSAGVFTASTTPGFYADTVQVASGGKEARTGVTVTAGSAATLEVTPSAPSVLPEGQVAFTATARDAYGNTVPVSARWSVEQGGGSIDAAGVFTAGTRAGVYTDTVRAVANGLSATATLRVEPGAAARLTLSPASATLAPEGQTRFTARIEDAHGNVRADAVTWSLADASAGALDATGTLTATRRAGTYPEAIRAQSGTLSATATLTVQPGALARLLLTPAPLELAVGESQALTARGLDEHGNDVALTPVWEVVSGGGTLTPEGLFTAGSRAGTYADTVRVSARGLSTSVSVVVKPGPVARVTLTPDAPEILSGGSLPFTVRAEDAFGNEVSSPAPVWTARAEAGQITGTGLFTAGATPGLYPDAVTVQVGDVKTATSVRIPVPVMTSGCASTGGASAPLWALLLLAGAASRRLKGAAPRASR